MICLFIKKSKDCYEKKQVLILAPLGLGDAINFLSVCDKYRKLYSKPKYEITLVTSKGLKELFETETDFDYIYCKDFESITINIKKRIEMFKFINSKHYDILIDIIGPVGCNPNMYVSAASSCDNKITIINKAYFFAPISLVKKSYTDIYEINNKKIANVDYYNKLFNLINKTKGKYEIKFHKIKNRTIKLVLPPKYYIVFPSASSNIKKWPLENYAEVINKIYNKIKIPVLFCGTNIDRFDVDRLISLINVPYVNIIDKTSVMDFIQIIKNAKFVITNDTSAYHIGVNEEVPTTIITGGYTYYGFVKYDFYNNNYKKPYIVVSKRKCFNCYNHCPYEKDNGIWPCLNDISLNDAWKVIEKMIDDIGEL